MSRVLRAGAGVLFALVVAAPALAQSSTSGLGFRGWGPRVGVADDPDQLVAGAHFDCGEFVRNLRFMPNFEIGFGDDHTVVAGNFPVHYLFHVDAAVTPYVGGGIVVGWIDHDDEGQGNDDDSDVEFGPKAVGGVEWDLKSSNRFFLELALDFSDLHDVQIMAGWVF